MSQLIYCATPSRLVHKTTEIMDFVAQQGHAPLHPFPALPHAYFEGNPNVGRQKTMDYCLRLVTTCDQVWMFGYSQGTLEELTHALHIGKPFRSYVAQFDPNWRTTLDQLKEQYKDALEKLRSISH